MDFARAFKYIAIGLVVFVFIVLGGWYTYLRNQTASVEQISDGRGIGQGEPAKAGSLGSTFSNIVAGFTKAPDAVRGETVQINAGGFKTAVGSFKNLGTGISDFSSSVKDAFGSLISGSLPDGEREQEKPKTPRLFHASKTPVAGFGFLGTSTAIRFMDRSSGHLFDINADTGEVTRVTNTLVSRAYEAEFTKDGSVIITSIDDTGERSVKFATVKTASTTDDLAELSIVERGVGILDTVSHKTSREILSLVTSENGSALIRSEWDGSKPVRLLTSTLQGWRLFFDRSPIILQKAASGVAGAAYKIENGNLIPIARNVPGLTVLPHPKLEVYLIGSDNSSVTLSVRSATSTLPLTIRTIADKCVWTSTLIAYCAAPDRITTDQFIDDWYRGTYHTSDTLWRVNAGGGATELLVSPSSEYNQSLDVENPMIDDGGEYIAFMNRVDTSLWILRVNDK